MKSFTRKKISVEKLRNMKAKTLARKAKFLYSTMSKEELSQIDKDKLQEANKILEKKMQKTIIGEGRWLNVGITSSGYFIASYLLGPFPFNDIAGTVTFYSAGSYAALKLRQKMLRKKLECLKSMQAMAENVSNRYTKNIEQPSKI